MNSLDQLRCNYCGAQSVYQRTMPDLRYGDQVLSKTDIAPLAVSCPACRHAYYYGESELPKVPLPEQMAGRDLQYPTEFYVPLVCGTADCDTPVYVKAVREPGTTKEAICAEVHTWTLHGMQCRGGHPLAEPVMQDGWCEAETTILRPGPRDSFLLHMEGGGTLSAYAIYGLGVARFRLRDGRRLNRIDDYTFRIVETGEDAFWRP
jgi:hypothetical protein